MQHTQEDIQLLRSLTKRAEQLQQGIQQGRPYVWELRLSLNEFYALESAINNSISSHAGKHDHLLTEEFAVIVVMYLAEWYKRFYKGSDTTDENKILALSSKELEKLYELAKIDKNTFVYNASKNPDKTSYRWLESMQVLGGLAVQAELKREENDKLLFQLCKIFHGEEIELDDLKDRNRAVAFQESIARQHSLYEYLKCILEKDEQGLRNLPFAKSDTMNENTYIPQLIRRIEEADKLAKRNKFDFEWLISYSASCNQMVRHLKVKLKPEVIGGGKKQYIGYDRLRQPEWGIEQPENIGRIRFYLRFKNGNQYIQKEGKEDPLFKYDNTGSETTGFLSVNNEDESIYTNVPVGKFDKVEIVMKYDDHTRVVQALEVKDYIQVYALPKKTTVFSDRRYSQRPTVVIFSSAYHLTEEYCDLPVVYAHYRKGEQTSEDYCWCPINDKVIIADNDGKEVTPPFFNRNGLYQVVTKKYLKTIKYRENLYVLYKYIDAEYDEDEYQEDPQMPVLFGRNGLEVRHYSSGQTKESEPVTDFDLEWMKDGRYVDWNKEEPQQGAIRLRVTVKGIVFKPQVYYVPFSPKNSEQPPIWRDFEHQRICTALEGVEDIQDDFHKLITEKEPDTKQLEIGTENAKILIEVYRPVIIKELSQKRSTDGESKVISYHNKEEDIHIPLIDCEQFSVRDFSENGVREYQVKRRSTVYYNFHTFNQTGLSRSNYLQEYSAKRLTRDVPLEYLKIYIAKAEDHPSNLYAWNYKDKPYPVESANELKETGIVFQSLKDNDSPRHYSCPTIITNEDDDWGDDDWDEVNVQNEGITPLDCFETVAEHKTYFFLFMPLIKVIARRSQIKDIFLPLLKKRDCRFNDTDIDNLYRFAMQFHFDWMLLPRSLWKEGIESFSSTDEELNMLQAKVTDFYGRTPKCTDELEQIHLKDFLKRYWSFDTYPKVEDIAEKALKLIKDEADALGNLQERDFLKLYDECRFKFIEMNKVVVISE